MPDTDHTPTNVEQMAAVVRAVERMGEAFTKTADQVGKVLATWVENNMRPPGGATR